MVDDSKQEQLIIQQPSTSRLSPWLTPLAYFLGNRVLMPFYFGRIKVTGQENLPSRGPVILAPTHRARWDALLVAYATGRGVTGRDLRFMVTADEVRGLQGWFIRRLGGFAINVSRPSITTLRHGVDLLRRGEMMVIFPEGGIFRDEEVHTLKPGLARIALQSEALAEGLGVKILPISLHYEQPRPRWGSHVEIRIGKPIMVEPYTQGTPKVQAKRLTAELSEALQNLSAGYTERPLAIAVSR
ncbi:lysophospholipid acyltransferase family protein [Almyronema epifaneia]|uniref:Lysophospholipid acyltransferase family protein n=1 Tax=Almyronema epifaneia S1 TaxID=2991925 RepID=A0ABW6I9E1_9CYAN